MQESKQVVLDCVKGRYYEIDFFDASHICIREFPKNPRCADRQYYYIHYATEPCRVVAVFDATTEGFAEAKKLCMKMNQSRL